MTPTFYLVLGKHVHAARIARKMTKADFAAAVGINCKTLVKVEDGWRVKPATVQALDSYVRLDFNKIDKEVADADVPTWRPLVRVAWRNVKAFVSFECFWVGTSVLILPRLLGISMKESFGPNYSFLLFVGLMAGTTVWSFWFPFLGFKGPDGELLDVRLRQPFRNWVLRKLFGLRR